MKVQTSEYCTVGHPDRMCDYIVSYILDRYLEKDPKARVALECQIKNHECTLSGEVTSTCRYSDAELAGFIRMAVFKVGYSETYREAFGRGNAIANTLIRTTVHITRQSPDIAQGVDADGWGDQGIFWGYAVDDPKRGYMPKDYYLARLLGNELYSSGLGGLDIKTQVTVESGKVTRCVVAIPIPEGLEDERMPQIREIVRKVCGKGCRTVINGTGRYVVHGPIGDCGTTGRKLVADFYGCASRIGGGSPWGKDPSKADVALNVFARRKAVEFLKRHGLDEVCCLVSCCIGKRRVLVSYYDGENEFLGSSVMDAPVSKIVKSLGLDRPDYAEACRLGLFGREGAAVTPRRRA